MTRFNTLLTALETLEKSLKNKNTIRNFLGDIIEKCNTLEDYLLFSEYCSTLNEHALALKSSEFAYSMAQSNEDLFLCRKRLATCFLNLNYPEKSIFYLDINNENSNNNFDTLTSLAAAYKFNGQRDKCEQLLDDIRNSEWVTKEQVDALDVTTSYRLLKSGKVAKGIEKYLLTRKEAPKIFDIYGMKRWDGIFRPGIEIYISAAGGIGDEIINFRFINTLKKNGMYPIYYSDLARHDLYDVFSRHGVEVIKNPIEIDKNLRWVDCMELPILMNVSENDLWDGAYIKSIKTIDTTAKTKKRLAIKVESSKEFSQHNLRKAPDLIEILNYIPEDYEVTVIQRNEVTDPIDGVNYLIEDNWEETIDTLATMDVVLSICTSVAHLSSAMGIKTLVLVPLLEYYTWTSTQNITTPWYSDSTILFRQTKPRHWADQLQKIQGELTKDG